MARLVEHRARLEKSRNLKPEINSLQDIFNIIESLNCNCPVAKINLFVKLLKATGTSQIKDEIVEFLNISLDVYADKLKHDPKDLAREIYKQYYQ